MPTDTQWAWIAGLFEGEGTIYFPRGNSVYVAIQMTDRDVLDTLDKWVPSPTGIKFARKAKTPAYRDQYQWILSSRDAVRGFLVGVRPWMHSRRGERIDEALRRLEANRGAFHLRADCPRGHPYSGDNLYTTPTGHRQCRACRKERA